MILLDVYRRHRVGCQIAPTLPRSVSSASSASLPSQVSAPRSYPQDDKKGLPLVQNNLKFKSMSLQAVVGTTYAVL